MVEAVDPSEGHGGVQELMPERSSFTAIDCNCLLDVVMSHEAQRAAYAALARAPMPHRAGGEAVTNNKIAHIAPRK